MSLGPVRVPPFPRLSPFGPCVCPRRGSAPSFALREPQELGRGTQSSCPSSGVWPGPSPALGGSRLQKSLAIAMPSAPLLSGKAAGQLLPGTGMAPLADATAPPWLLTPHASKAGSPTPPSPPAGATAPPFQLVQREGEQAPNVLLPTCCLPLGEPGVSPGANGSHCVGSGAKEAG